jgi:hypothetical protein
VLHFTNIDADETVAGNQDFTFISTAAFTAPGQINWFSNGTDTFMQFNTDADLAADGMIQLSGVLSGDSVLMCLWDGGRRSQQYRASTGRAEPDDFTGYRLPSLPRLRTAVTRWCHAMFCDAFCEG